MNGNVEGSLSHRIAELTGLDLGVRGIGSRVSKALGDRQIFGNSCEQSQVLGLVVFAVNFAVFADWTAVIVRGRHYRASKSTPVGSTVHHVETDGGRPLRYEIAIEPKDE